ncbi:DNA adenine methylase, partial [Candidatus Pacearchaeota archaeon]|nr:DNA adenine methylase [Candidatus Pacearchaeota archaeon]
TYPKALEILIERLQGVVIENRPAGQILLANDSPETLHYIDPPYPMITRGANRYRHEMADKDHRDLAGLLHDLRGMVIISGYPCSLYDVELFHKWQRIEKETFADGARERTEVLWLSPSASKALSKEGRQLRMEI